MTRFLYVILLVTSALKYYLSAIKIYFVYYTDVNSGFNLSVNNYQAVIVVLKNQPKHFLLYLDTYEEKLQKILSVSNFESRVYPAQLFKIGNK